MKKFWKKRISCLIAAAVVMLSAGCGNKDSEAGKLHNTQEDITGAEETGGSENARGRYVEEETDLSDLLEQVKSMRLLPDGRLVITDSYRSLQVSEDQGITWTKQSNGWLDERGDGVYILDIKMAPDGTLAVIYDDSAEREAKETKADSSTEADSLTEGDSSTEVNVNIETEANGSESPGGEDETQESLFHLDPKCVLIRPDGEVVPVFPELKEEDDYPVHFWISDSGRFFITSYGEDIYEVKQDGESELFLTVEGNPQLVQFMGDTMILDGYDFAAPLLYDMEKKEYVEDQVLTDFIAENYPDRQFNGGSWYDLYLFPGEEGTIYLAGEKGLYRHVPGQEETERLIDGALSRLGSPKYGLKDMIMLEEGEFLALFSGGKLVRFSYDPDIASVPAGRLKVYSLKESYDIRVAAAAYQVQNPDVFVEYEIGMEEGGAVTREDALKKLNTRIMAGEGPDVLMLDGLPVDSYIQKGLLLELDGFLEDFGEDKLFGNLIRASWKDKGIYGIPAQVAFPILLGKEEYVSDMKGLGAIADGIERLRRDNPGKDLLGICSEKGIMKIFASVSAPSWKKTDGEIDRDALSDFLTQTKRIYEAQMDGISEKSIERYNSASEYSVRDYGEDWEYDISFYGGMSLNYIGGYQQLLTGLTTYPYGYFDLTSVHKAKGFEDAHLMPMEGQSSKVFVPRTLLGINAASGKKELAEDFLKLFFEKENQYALGGFPINRAALEELFTPEENYLGENGQYGSIGMSDEDGLEVYMDVYLPSEEELSEFYSWMESMDTPYIEEQVLERAVFEEGSKFILGQAGLEEALDAIEQRLAIYMAE